MLAPSGAVDRAGRGLVLACSWSLALSACLPSAQVETPTPDPTPATETSAPRHALVAGTMTLYADPDLDGQHVEIDPVAEATAEEATAEEASAGRVVELLEADASETWWRVRTLQPREALALGLDATSGLALLSLEGWVEARQVRAWVRAGSRRPRPLRSPRPPP